MYLKFYIIFQIYPTHLRSVYDPSGMILAILYKEVPHMLHAKYQPNQLSGSSEELSEWFLPYMGMTAILNFRSSSVFGKSCITIIQILNMKFH